MEVSCHLHAATTLSPVPLRQGRKAGLDVAAKRKIPLLQGIESSSSRPYPILLTAVPTHTRVVKPWETTATDKSKITAAEMTPQYLHTKTTKGTSSYGQSEGHISIYPKFWLQERDWLVLFAECCETGSQINEVQMKWNKGPKMTFEETIIHLRSKQVSKRSNSLTTFDDKSGNDDNLDWDNRTIMYDETETMCNARVAYDK